MRSTHAVCQTAHSSCETTSVQISMGVFWRHLNFTRTTCVLKGNHTFKYFTQCHRYLCNISLGPKSAAFQGKAKASHHSCKYKSPVLMDKSLRNLTDLEPGVPSNLNYPVIFHVSAVLHLHAQARCVCFAQLLSWVCTPSSCTVPLPALGWQQLSCYSALPAPLQSHHWNWANHVGATAMQRQAERHGVEVFFLGYQTKWVWKLEKDINYSWFQIC